LSSFWQGLSPRNEPVFPQGCFVGVTGGTTMSPRQKLLSKFNDERCGLRAVPDRRPMALIWADGAGPPHCGNNQPKPFAHAWRRHASPAKAPPFASKPVEYDFGMAIEVGMFRCGGFCL
jgi:hypothetical protein